MLDLSALVRDPAAAAKLSPEERTLAVQQCAALIIALAVAPLPVKEPAPASVPAGEVYLTVEQAAARIQRAVSTLYHWIGQGKLKPETGLRRVQGQPLIEWAIFRKSFVERE